MSTNKRGGTSFIICNAAGEFLLQFRDGTAGIDYPLQWDFFGGACEEDETIEECSAREMREELGIEALPQDFELVTTQTIDGLIEHLVRYTRCVEWGDISLGEGAGYAFFTQEELVGIATINRVKIFGASYL